MQMQIRVRVFFFCTVCCLSLTGVNGKDTRAIRKRGADTESGPYYDSSLIGQHQFVWRQPYAAAAGITVPFEDHLKRSLAPADFFYILTGDTQHWTPCTADNIACQRATDYCSSREQSSAVDCNQRQSEFANKMQQISMAALNRRLNDSLGRKAILGLIINGDLTEFGHGDEVDRLKKLWTSTKFDNSIRVYPGLGNHDYANNVGECTLDHCVNRMLKWFRDYVKDTMKIRLDLRTSTKYLVTEENTGSFAYSWDECSTDPTGTTGSEAPGCVHFVQLNNYPTYVRNIDGWFLDWKILPSLNWLLNDLRRDGANKSVVINFHDFDTAFSPTDKLQFRNVLEAVIAGSPQTRILAIFFAHIHERVGVKEYWCLGGRRVPLIYSGSVPGNNYLLAHFSPLAASLKALYAMRVEAETVSYVEIEAIPGEQERCE